MEALTDQRNHNRLMNAYLRLAAERKKIKESPGTSAIRGEPEQPKRKPKKQKQEPPVEQLRMF